MVSVIIPVYNTDKYLKRCIESVLGQTYKNIEIILVNDGSTDTSGEICDQYSLVDSRVHVIHQKNQGVSIARIHGYEKSAGQFITFVDSDDTIDERMVEVLVKTQQDTLTEMVVCQFKHINNNNEEGVRIVRPEPGFYDRKDIISLLATNALYDVKYQRAGVSFELWGKLYQRDILRLALQEGIGIWFEEDMLITLKIMYHLNSMVVLSDPFYLYYERIGQATKSYKVDIAKNFLKTLEKIQEIDHAGYLKKQLPLRIIVESSRILSICERQSEGREKFKCVFQELTMHPLFNKMLLAVTQYENSIDRLKCFLLIHKWRILYFMLLRLKHKLGKV